MRPAYRALFLALAGIALAACGAQEPVTDADKALFLRVADLAEFGVRYPNAEAAESFSKTKQPDGSYEITYKFETSGEVRPLFLQGSVNVGRNTSDAMLAESAEKIGLLVAFKKNGVEEREVPGVRAGKLTLLVKGDVPIGNVFTLRDGARTHLLIMSGLYVKDPVVWQKLMQPKLDRLARYAPEAKAN
jgi:hypothetical protein